MKITEKQLKALRAVCEVIIPALEGDAYWQRKASDFQVAEKMIEQIEMVSKREQKEFQNLLKLLSSRVLGVTWRGPLKPAHRLSKVQLEKMLNFWSHSSFNQFRKGFNTIKKLCSLIFFGQCEKGTNPNWLALGYEKLPESPKKADALSSGIVDLKESSVIDCDVAIVGSGAGGGVVAAVLAKKGLKVIVIEKGPYLRNEALNQEELDMYNQQYEGKGLLTSVDGGLTVLAGACLGGGTTVNWAGAFRTPDFILEEWAREHDNPHFLEADYKKGFDYIENRNHITPALLRHNPQNETLITGAEKLSWKASVIPRNVLKPEGLSQELFWKSQGFSPLGDRYGSKQSSIETFLQDAVDHGAQIMPNTTARKINHQAGILSGLEITTSVNGRPINSSIRAKKVVLSAGSIQTPALLKRSGLDHKETGKNLYLHPTIPVTAVYEEPSFPWHGPMMSAVIEEFVQLDGNYGFRIETPPVHPGLFAVVSNWQNGKQFKQDVLDAQKTQCCIVLTRDKYGGEVKIDKHGQPLIHHRLHDYDKKTLVKGMEKSVELHAAMGARKINVLHNQALIYERGRDDLQFMINEIARRKWNPNYFGLYTAHQMGTCRMGGSNKSHPVKPNGETRALKNLFVADSSLFPSASGANPMLSIQALAYYVAQQIA